MVLPTTPLTAASISMDSEDEFISGMSSEDVDMVGEDSDDSLGEGKIQSVLASFCWRLRAE